MAESQTDTPVSFRVDDELVEEIESQLEYGDSKSDWIREAIRQRLAADTADDSDTADGPE
jgi:Arc/MetJ-type ribon-helix-helix transcriptional regulator